MLSTPVAWIALLLFAGTMAFAGAKDALTMTISNRLVVFLCIAYLVLAPAAGVDRDAAVMSALAAATALACTIGLFTMGWIGGGDAKLVPVAILWLGHGLALAFVLYASVFGAALTLLILQLRRVSVPAPLASREWFRRMHDEDTGIPYGVALAMAALVLLPQTHWYTAVL
ncbi:MAG TPA: prepilin peptidase [Rhizobium sp.]|nr:prepilin peptidase [Rhizobium sp.]